MALRSAMPVQRRTPALLLLLAACGLAATFAGLRATSSPAFMTVVGSAPAAPRADAVAPSLDADFGAAEVAPMNRPYDYLKDKDQGDVRGEAAYQHPPPVPSRKAGLMDGTWKGKCDRDYRVCYGVCRRFPDLPQKRNDCKYDCFRKRRACYFQARPKAERIRRI